MDYQHHSRTHKTPPPLLSDRFEPRPRLTLQTGPRGSPFGRNPDDLNYLLTASTSAMSAHQRPVWSPFDTFAVLDATTAVQKRLRAYGYGGFILGQPTLVPPNSPACTCPGQQHTAEEHSPVAWNHLSFFPLRSSPRSDRSTGSRSSSSLSPRSPTDTRGLIQRAKADLLSIPSPRRHQTPHSPTEWLERSHPHLSRPARPKPLSPRYVDRQVSPLSRSPSVNSPPALCRPTARFTSPVPPTPQLRDDMEASCSTLDSGRSARFEHLSPLHWTTDEVAPVEEYHGEGPGFSTVYEDPPLGSMTAQASEQDAMDVENESLPRRGGSSVSYWADCQDCGSVSPDHAMCLR